MEPRAYANPKPEQVSGRRQMDKPSAAYFDFLPSCRAVVPCRRAVRESNLEAILGRGWSKRCTKICVMPQRRLDNLVQAEAGASVVRRSVSCSSSACRGVRTPTRPARRGRAELGRRGLWAPLTESGRGRRRLRGSDFGSSIQKCEVPAGKIQGPDPGRVQTRPHACDRCLDGRERRSGVREEPCRMPKAESGRPWWARFWPGSKFTTARACDCR